MAHFIVVGNEKGGAGKSTVSMHISTALARMGHSVAALDLDLRQRSLGRYLENRTGYCQRNGLSLPTPANFPLPEIDRVSLAPGENLHDRQLTSAIAEIEQQFEFILIDCPGSHTRLSQMAHSLADTLVTPLNDSFVDFDLLAKIDPANGQILGPSVYSEMVWNSRQLRAQSGMPPIDWIVLRNRLGSQQMHNKRKMGESLLKLARRIGFRVVPGFSERVVFREMFLNGMTLLDLKDIGVRGLNLSNVAARQEVRDMITELNLPNVKVRL